MREWKSMILGGSEGDVCIVSLKGFGGKD